MKSSKYSEYLIIYYFYSTISSDSDQEEELEEMAVKTMYKISTLVKIAHSLM